MIKLMPDWTGDEARHRRSTSSGITSECHCRPWSAAKRAGMLQLPPLPICCAKRKERMHGASTLRSWTDRSWQGGARARQRTSAQRTSPCLGVGPFEGARERAVHTLGDVPMPSSPIDVVECAALIVIAVPDDSLAAVVDDLAGAGMELGAKRYFMSVGGMALLCSSR